MLVVISSTGFSLFPESCSGCCAQTRFSQILWRDNKKLKIDCFIKYLKVFFSLKTNQIEIYTMQKQFIFALFILITSQISLDSLNGCFKADWSCRWLCRASRKSTQTTREDFKNLFLTPMQREKSSLQLPYSFRNVIKRNSQVNQESLRIF